MSGKLDGKVAVVTGGGRGVGRGIAKLFAVEGAKVVIGDNGSQVDGSGSDAGPAHAVVAEIEAAGGSAVANVGDVSKWSDAEALIGAALDEWGKLDILVNVAGNFRADTIANATPENLDALVNVHMQGMMATSHFAALHWKERGEYGRLINFTSDSGMLGVPDTLTYAMAKAGIIGLTRAAANALVSYNVTANGLTQGSHTRMGDDYNMEDAKQYHRKTGHWPHEDTTPERSPDNVAPLVAYLASPQAANITGRIFGSYGYQYLRWSEPKHERVLLSDGPWDLDRLFAEFPQTLGEGLSTDDLPFPMESLEKIVRVGTGDLN